MVPNTCQTVQIQGTPNADNPTGVTVINVADFDAKTMTLATPSAEGSRSEAPEAKSGKKVVPWAA